MTALARALEAVVLRLWLESAGDAVELACGDGINSLIARGGTLRDDFDAFVTVPLAAPQDFFGGSLDVYDTEDPPLRSDHRPVVTPPRAVWQFGLDHKPNLLKKAARLGCFRELIPHDLNLPAPLASESASFVFSNSIYWVDNIDGLLADIHRILRPGGRGTFVIIDPRFYRQMAWNRLEPYPFRRFLDMGRHLHYRTLLTRAEWEARFRRAALQVERTIPMFNDNLVHMIEFHDYREISPLTAFMTRHLTESDLATVKQEWIRYADFICTAMYQDGFLNPSESNSNYWIYLVMK